MEPKDEKTLTIARRSRKNLQYIYKKKRQGEDVEEFTQLLNSMLGMVICLREDYFKGDTITWEEVEALNLPTWDSSLKKITGSDSTVSSPKLKKVHSFSKLMTNIRHAFAHNCFSLMSSKKGGLIIGVEVWNIPSGAENRPENRTWQAKIREKELMKLADIYVDYIEEQIGGSITTLGITQED